MPRTESSAMISRLVALGFAVVVSLLVPSAGLAEPSSPAADQVRQPTVTPSAESEYNRGIRARLAKDWATAVEAFRGAITLHAAFPEAWNELGYALRNQGRYTEALQYLGEAYVKLGRLGDARRILDLLRPLDAGRAKELAEVIQAGR